MSYRLETTHRFEKDFRKLPSNVKRQVDSHLSPDLVLETF